MAIPIPGDVRKLLQAPSYVHLSTLRADGSPRSWVVCAGLEDDHILGCNALTLMAEERGGPQIAAQVLFYPVTDANLDTGTYQRYADRPWVTREAMRWFWDSYLPDRARRAEITASPLQASVDQLHGLPPALIINAEHDVLRDAGEAYAQATSYLRGALTS